MVDTSNHLMPMPYLYLQCRVFRHTLEPCSQVVVMDQVDTIWVWENWEHRDLRITSLKQRQCLWHHNVRSYVITSGICLENADVAREYWCTGNKVQSCPTWIGNIKHWHDDHEDMSHSLGHWLEHSVGGRRRGVGDTGQLAGMET